MRSLRIAHVMSYFQPKLGYQEFYLAREQQKMGHAACVITSDRFFPFKSFSQTFGTVLEGRYVGRGIFNEDGVQVVRLPCFFEFYDQIFIKNLRKALVNFRPDVVHVHDEISYFVLISLIYKFLLNYSVVVDVHSDYVNMSKNLKRRFVFHMISKNPIYRLFFSRADAYIAISENCKRWLSNELGIEEKQITVVPLGADAELFSPNALQRRQLRDKYRFGDSAVVVYAGKLIPGKDVELLLEATSTLIKKGLNVRVLVVGSGLKNYQTKLEELTKRLQISDYVVFHSFVDRKVLPSFYNAADIGAWPGDPSITIIEAMAVGLPVVVPYSECTSHYFKRDVGLRFSRGNVAELAKCLEILVSDADVRRKKGLKARTMVTSDLNWRSISKQMLEIYEDTFKK